MLLLAITAALALGPLPQQEVGAAQRMLQKLGVVKKGERPMLAKLDYEEQETTFSSADYYMTLSADGNLSYFVWHVPQELFSKRYETTPTLTDSKAMSEAKRYVHMLWPKQRFKFSGPSFPGSDPNSPTKGASFTPIVNGVLADEAFSGDVEIDAIGGELRGLRAPKIPLPPANLKPKIGREDAETTLLSKIRAKDLGAFISVSTPCELRIGYIGKPEAGKPGRLIYRFYGVGFSMIDPDKNGYYGNLMFYSMDATTGEILQTDSAFPGGKAPFPDKVPRITEDRFRAILLAGNRRFNLRGAAIKEVKPAAVTKVLGSFMLVGKQTLTRVYYTLDNRLFIAFDSGWYEATPDEQLRKTLDSVKPTLGGAHVQGIQAGLVPTGL